ncbi:enhancer of split malpha protein [Teleopsis dalmanni]|uniref:Enhancer of split region protein HLHma n=1 Tax=Teleopsis dalmanni TaxID=139649 RepID=G9I1L4_TELDL|nr:enhancer of split malpha protein [Teleopsis dalmanni]AEV91201.1 enhancer of split region protein HLHma [Teleopsis dalmanni]
MCQQVQAKINSNNNNKMKPSYSIKKVLKTLFKKQQKKLSNSLESLESLQNQRNYEIEQHFYEEIVDNTVNEKLADLAVAEEQDIYVPVRFARTDAGTFFWTTNLLPVTSTIIPAADEDLLQPAFCYSNCQFPHMQFQDRWAQA